MSADVYPTQLDATLAALDETRGTGGKVHVCRDTGVAGVRHEDGGACWCGPVELDPDELLTRGQVVEALRAARAQG